MTWLALELEVEGAASEPLSEALLELGADSVSVEEAPCALRSQARLEDLPVPRWARHRIRALVSPGTDPSAFVREAAHAAGLPDAPRFEVHRVEAEDWVRRTQSQFGPLQIGERLWIVPSWAEPPATGDAVVLRLDPGLAFGTGSHPTTRLVLGWIEEQFLRAARPHSLLDYGCGSGILALAAARLGAGAVVATDNDPQALLACVDNAAKNGLAIEVLSPEAIGARQFDLVVANILARPLVELAPLLASHARPGSRLALSGILEEQLDDVIAAYAPWFDVAAAGADEGWTLVAGVRR